jgi:KaiC/GvpD/RAD55 family RecA-like ATPase
MEKFILIKKSLKDTGVLLPVSYVDDKVINAHKSLFSNTNLDKDDLYSSLYIFSKDAEEYFKKNNNSIAGYTGKVYADRLFFDLDSKKDVSKAQTDAKELLHRLQKAGVDVSTNARVYFSGNKGFHIEVPLVDKTLEPEELKQICSNIAAGLDSFDDVIYNSSRTIRIVNTRHQDSGLFKIEIDPYDLVELSLDQIKESAKTKTKSTFSIEPVKDTSFLDKFKSPTPPKFKSVVVDDSNSVDGIRGLDEVDFSTCPKSKPRCIHALETGIMISGVGERSQVFLRLACYYRNQGTSKEGAYGLLKGVARDNARLYPDSEPFKKSELWNTTMNSAYGKSWKLIPGAFGTDPKNDILKKYCDAVGKFTSKPCCVHHQLQENRSVVLIDEVSEDFDRFAMNFDKNVVKTGIEFIDKNMQITTGTTSLWVGAAGSGKTTAALNVLETSCLNNQASAFFSMDMNKNLVYLKLAMKLTKYTKEQIFKFHQERNKAKIGEIKEIIAKTYNKTHFDFSTTLSLEQMRDRIFDIEQRTGEKMKFVLIDYAGRITGPHSDRYANSTYNALKTVEVANSTDTAMIILSQISRQTGDGCTPIRTKRAAKESGDWEESATNVITMWRPYMGDAERDDVARLFLAKNRMGSELEQVLHWDGAKSLLRDLSFDELAEYNMNRGEKAERDYLKARNGKTFTD